MIPKRTLDLIVKRLVKAAQPTKIIMFGSHARGNADEGSDLDLLVVKREVANRGEEMVRLLIALGEVDVPVDVLVYSENDIKARRNWSSSAVHWALKEGRILYEAQA